MQDQEEQFLVIFYQSIDLNTSDDEGYLYYSIPRLDSTTSRRRRNLLQKAHHFDVRNSLMIDMCDQN